MTIDLLAPSILVRLLAHLRSSLEDEGGDPLHVRIAAFIVHEYPGDGDRLDLHRETLNEYIRVLVQRGLIDVVATTTNGGAFTLTKKGSALASTAPDDDLPLPEEPAVPPTTVQAEPLAPPAIEEPDAPPSAPGEEDMKKPRATTPTPDVRTRRLLSPSLAVAFLELQRRVSINRSLDAHADASLSYEDASMAVRISCATQRRCDLDHVARRAAIPILLYLCKYGYLAREGHRYRVLTMERVAEDVTPSATTAPTVVASARVGKRGAKAPRRPAPAASPTIVRPKHAAHAEERENFFARSLAALFPDRNDSVVVHLVSAQRIRAFLAAEGKMPLESITNGRIVATLRGLTKAGLVRPSYRGTSRAHVRYYELTSLGGTWRDRIDAVTLPAQPAPSGVDTAFIEELRVRAPREVAYIEASLALSAAEEDARTAARTLAACEKMIASHRTRMKKLLPTGKKRTIFLASTAVISSLLKK